MRNHFKARLQACEPQFGLFVVSNALQNAEALAGSGFDYLCFDLEHSPSSTPALHAQLAAVAGTGTACVARLAGLDLSAFKHHLDLGVDALMVPNIHTPEQAREAVRYTRYPVDGGVRGLGGTMRATRYGRDKAYFAEAAANTCLLVQIESAQGLRNLDAICAVDGVDLLFFGPPIFAPTWGTWASPAIRRSSPPSRPASAGCGPWASPAACWPPTPIANAISMPAPAWSSWARTWD